MPGTASSCVVLSVVGRLFWTRQDNFPGIIESSLVGRFSLVWGTSTSMFARVRGSCFQPGADLIECVNGLC